MQLAQKRKIQLVTVTAVVFAFILFLVLLTLLVQGVQLASVKADLKQQIERLEELENTLNREAEYRQTLEYIQRYAREELGMIAAWETVWKPNKTDSD